MTQDRSKLVLFAIIVTAIVGGAVPVAGKVALLEMPTFSFTLIRFLFAVLVLLPFYWKIKQSIDFISLVKIVGLSLLAVGNFVFFAIGIQHTSAGITQAIYTSSPILAAIFSYFIVGEKFNIQKIVGVVVGFVGALILIFLPLIEKGLADGVTLFGNIIIVIASVSITLFTVYSKIFQKKYHPLEITTIFSFVAVAVSLIFSFFELKSFPGWWRDVSFQGILSVFYVGVFGTAFYYLVSQYIIKKSTPVIASMVLYVQPFATLLWAWIFLQEIITFRFVIGILLALLGVWLTLNPQFFKNHFLKNNKIESL